LVETYGVRPDPEMHREVLARVAPLDIATYRGFAMPRLVPVYDAGELVDVRLEAATGFTEQMLEYSERYGFLAGQRDVKGRA
jgi:dipeptidyl-peptidase-3